MIVIKLAFALCLILLARSLSPSYCWDFASAGAVIPNTCSATSNNLVKQGSPTCDFSGYALGNGDLFEGDIPADIGSTWTLLIWIKSNAFSNYQAIFSLYVSSDNSRTTPLLNWKGNSEFLSWDQDILCPPHKSCFLLDQVGRIRDGLPFMYLVTRPQLIMDSEPTLLIFKAFHKLEKRQSPLQLITLRLHLRHLTTGYIMGPITQGLDRSSQFEEYNYSLGSLLASNLQMFNQNWLQVVHKVQKLGNACPQLLSESHQMCSGSDWVHYRFSQEFLTNSDQTIIDNSGNNQDGHNGNTLTADSFDGSLTQYGIELAGTHKFYTPAIPLGSTYTSYSIQFYTLYSPTINTSFTLLQDSDLVLSVNNLDVTVQYFGVPFTQTCLASTEFQPRLFALSILQTSSTSVYLNFYLNKVECMSMQINNPITNLSGGYIGDGFIGTISEFKITKLVNGKEAYEGFAPDYICGSQGQFDYTNRVCVSCHISCATCMGSTVYDCNSCASSYVFSIQGQCLLCGNGVVDAGEQCDDSNQLDGDGCSSICQFESTQASCTSGVTLCTQVTPLYIENTAVQAQNDDLLVTIFLSREVFVNNLKSKLIAFQFTGVDSSKVEVTMDQLVNIQVRSILIILTPQISLKGTQVSLTLQKTFSFNLTCINTLYSLDSFTSTPSYLSQEQILLPQFQYQSSLFSKAIKIAGYTMDGATGLNLAGGLITSMTLQITLQPLWGFINSNQLVFFIPLIAVPLPRNALTLFSLLSFVNGDFYVLELAYQNSVGRSLAQEMDTPFNSRFEILGFSTSNIIENCGIIFLILLFKIFILLMFLLLSKICCFEWPKKCSSMMKWAPFIRLIFQAFFELMICALVNILNLSFDCLPEILAFAISILVLSFLIIFMSKLMFVTAYPQYELTDHSTKVYTNYSQIYNGLELKRGFIAQNYNTWFLFRRLILSILLVYFALIPLLQLSIHIFLGVIQIIILLKKCPFQDMSTITLLTLNQLHLLLLYGLVTVLHFNQTNQSLQMILGMVLVVSILAVNGFNLVFISVFQCIRIKSNLKAKKLRKKQTLMHQKYLNNRRVVDSCSTGGLVPKSAWANDKPNFVKGSKEEENYIKETFFCKSCRSRAEKHIPSFFHPLAN